MYVFHINNIVLKHLYTAYKRPNVYVLQKDHLVMDQNVLAVIFPIIGTMIQSLVMPVLNSKDIILKLKNVNNVQVILLFWIIMEFVQNALLKLLLMLNLIFVFLIQAFVVKLIPMTLFLKNVYALNKLPSIMDKFVFHAICLNIGIMIQTLVNHALNSNIIIQLKRNV